MGTSGIPPKIIYRSVKCLYYSLNPLALVNSFMHQLPLITYSVHLPFLSKYILYPYFLLVTHYEPPFGECNMSPKSCLFKMSHQIDYVTKIYTRSLWRAILYTRSLFWHILYNRLFWWAILLTHPYFVTYSVYINLFRSLVCASTALWWAILYIHLPLMTYFVSQLPFAFTFCIFALCR